MESIALEIDQMDDEEDARWKFKVPVSSLTKADEFDRVMQMSEDGTMKVLPTKHSSN